MANESGQLKLFNKMQRELVMMGMISFGVFIVESAVTIDTHGAWFFSFEIIHIVIVFMGFSFLFQAFFLMSYSSSFMKQQLKAFRKTSKELLKSFDELKAVKISLLDKIQAVYDLFVTREQSEYKIIRELFVHINPTLPENFNFSAYIGILFHTYIAELGEVSPYTWLFLACIVCISGFKNGVIDPATSNVDYFEGKHIGILRYGIVCGFMLSVACGILLSMSYYYYYCMIKKGIHMVDCFGSAKIISGKLDETTYRSCLSILMDRDAERDIAEKLNRGDVNLSKKPRSANRLKTSASDLRKSPSRKTIDLNALKKQREEKEFRRLHTQLRSKHLPVASKLYNYYRAAIHFIRNFGHVSHHTEESGTVLHKIFAFSSPALYFYLIEVALLLQCFYAAIYLTQLIPTAADLSDAGRKAGWVIGTTIPIFINLFLIRCTLTYAVILRGIYELHHEAFSLLIEQELSEEQMKEELREKILEALGESETGKELSWDERKTLIQENFNEFDYDGSGEISKEEFREFLGHLHVYLSQRMLDLLWNVLDHDLSGSINFDELFVFIFPLSKDKMKTELGSVQKLREKYKERMLGRGIPQSEWSGELKVAFESFDIDKSGFIDSKEFTALVCWVDKELGLSKDVRTIYNALDIADHRSGISWLEVVKLLDTSNFRSKWLDDINRIRRYLKDEFEGQDIEHREDQVIALKEVYDTSMHNIHCRKRSGMKHFKHMLYLQEIEINPKAVNKFFEAINLKGKDPFSWEEIYAFFFATENTAETNSVLVTIKKRILAAHPKPNTSQELLKSFQRFDEDNSGKLDRYEFKALLKDFNLILDVSSERFLLAAKNFWDSDGMIGFETLSKLIETPDEAFGETIELHNIHT
jgi:Ca2+-binding EF-hand superfamily protein